MIKRLLILITLLLVIIPGVTSAQAAPLATSTLGAIGGTLVGETINAGVTTLLVNTPKHGQISVVISSGTIFVRRLNGASALDELSLNDVIAVKGSFATGSTTVFNASAVKDFTIQEGFTRAVLLVTKVTTSTTTTSFTAAAMHDRVSRLSPFSVGTMVTVTVSTSGSTLTPVLMWSHFKIVAGTAANIHAGQTVTVLGVYNRQLHTYIKTIFVRIH